MCRVELFQADDPQLFVAVGQGRGDQRIKSRTADPRQRVDTQQSELAILIVGEKTSQRLDSQWIVDFGDLLPSQVGLVAREPAAPLLKLAIPIFLTLLLRVSAFHQFDFLRQPPRPLVALAPLGIHPLIHRGPLAFDSGVPESATGFDVVRIELDYPLEMFRPLRGQAVFVAELGHLPLPFDGVRGHRGEPIVLRFRRPIAYRAFFSPVRPAG